MLAPVVLFVYNREEHTRQTLEALKGYGLPEVDYFMEHFLPAFSLTLDEMGQLQKVKEF